MKNSKKNSDRLRIDEFASKFRKLTLEELDYKMKNHYEIMLPHAQKALKKVISEKK